MLLWSPEEYQFMLDLIKENPSYSYATIAKIMTERFGREFTENAVRCKLKRDSKTTKTTLFHENRKNEINNSLDELLNLVIHMQEELQRLDDRQTEVSVTIDDDKPIGIVFTGDLHIGGLYTDHRQMLHDFHLIRETEGLYAVLMGDYTDNYITRSHPGGSFEQVITADKQRKLCEYIFDKFFSNGKTIAVLKGNHDNWSTKETGEDFVTHLARKIGSPYLWYGGAIKVKLGNAEYLIHAHHTFKYNSSLNTTNSQRNLFNITHADVIALGHVHTNEAHQKSVGGKDTIWLRTGSYKITDDYSQWLGGLKADPRIPMVILWPDSKKVLGFRDFRDGITHLKVVREGVTVEV